MKFEHNSISPPTSFASKKLTDIISRVIMQRSKICLEGVPDMKCFLIRWKKICKRKRKKKCLDQIVDEEECTTGERIVTDNEENRYCW